MKESVVKAGGADKTFYFMRHGCTLRFVFRREKERKDWGKERKE